MPTVQGVLVANLINFRDVLMSVYDQYAGKQIQVRQKGNEGPVCELDLAFDQAAREWLNIFCPGIKVCSEEVAHQWPVAEDEFFVVDPLDGTRNYTAGFPCFGFQLVYVKNNQVLFACILLPKDEKDFWRGMFFVLLDGGAWYLQKKTMGRMQVPSGDSLSHALCLLEGKSKKVLQSQLVQNVLGKIGNWRLNISMACSTVSLVSSNLAPEPANLLVTCGNKPWDNLPALLFIPEAGGVVRCHDGSVPTLEHCSDIVAGKSSLVEQVLALGNMEMR